MIDGAWGGGKFVFNGICVKINNAIQLAAVGLGVQAGSLGMAET